MTTEPRPFNDAELLAAWRRGEQERAYWDAHAGALTARYPDHFVAVHDGAVVATNADLLGLLADLDARGLAVTDCWLRFLPGPDAPTTIPTVW